MALHAAMNSSSTAEARIATQGEAAAGMGLFEEVADHRAGASVIELQSGAGSLAVGGACLPRPTH